MAIRSPHPVVGVAGNITASAEPVSPARRRGRPSKQVAGFGLTRDALLHSGVVALTEKGYGATTVDEILQGLGVPKGSFYHFFASKDAFVAAAVDSYGAYFDRKLERCFGDVSRSPLQRLRDFTLEAEAGMARYKFRRGCLIGNLGGELQALPESFRAQLNAILESWERRTAACLRAAQEAGEIGPGRDCTRSAVLFWTGWEGAVLRARLALSAEPLSSFARSFIADLRNPIAPREEE